MNKNNNKTIPEENDSSLSQIVNKTIQGAKKHSKKLLSLALVPFAMYIIDKAAGEYAHANDLSQQYVQTSDAKFAKGDLNGALKDAQAAIRADPNDWEGWNNVASYHAKNKNFKKALPFAQKAYKLTSGNCKTIGGLAYLNAKIGQKNEAIRLYTEKLKFCPKDQKAKDWITYLSK